MGVSQNESLIFLFQIGYHALYFSISLEEIIDKKAQYTPKRQFGTLKKHDYTLPKIALLSKTFR